MYMLLMFCDHLDYIRGGASYAMARVGITLLLCPLMKVWVYAVATWWQGRLTLMSEFYLTTGAAQEEYAQMGMRITFRVMP